MGFTNKIQTVNLDEMDDFQRIDSNLRNLIVSMEGTIPGSRGFGMPIDVADLIPYDARNEFAAALDEKVEQYIPEIMIDDVDFDMDEEGNMIMQIAVEENDEYEEGDEDDD